MKGQIKMRSLKQAIHHYIILSASSKLSLEDRQTATQIWHTLHDLYLSGKAY